MNTHIRRLRIKNFRGIEELDQPIADGGALFKGANGQGKTTAIAAIRAALEGRDIAKDAIRNGATEAEILVDMDDVTVRRAISEASSRLSVTNRADESRWTKPQTRLDDLLGGTLDPLEFYLGDEKKRRALVFSAMPAKLDGEDVKRWIGIEDEGCTKVDVVEVNAITLQNKDAHPLQVIGLMRKHFYDKRTAANGETKKVQVEVDELEKEIAADAAKLPEGKLDVVECTARVHRLTEERDSLVRQVVAWRAWDESMQKTRAKVATMRQEAAARRAAWVDVPTEADLDALSAVTAEKHSVVDEIDERMRLLSLERDAALEAYEAAVQQQERGTDRRDRYNEELERCAAIDANAAELEALVAEPAKPTDESIDAAHASLVGAGDLLQMARKQDDVAGEREMLAEKTNQLREWTKEANRLDGIVKRLTDQAPVDLMKRTGGIPGLELRDDGIFLDGVDLVKRSGREQLLFAVDLARRVSKSKLLVCDGLERLDPDQMDNFVHAATADGWQLLATRVDRGEMVVEAITAEPA